MDKMFCEKRKKLERKCVLVFALLLVTTGVISSYIDMASATEPVPTAAAVPQQNEHEGIIRFHVIANSDRDADQALKLKVRNNVLAKLQNDLAAEMAGQVDGSPQGLTVRAAITREYIQENMESILRWAEEAIAAEGYDYPVQGNLGVTWIPAKTYDDVYFPPGNYEALNLVIGEGKGQNWWCVIFPPLCLIDSKDEIQKERMALKDGSRIILKSKIREMLER